MRLLFRQTFEIETLQSVIHSILTTHSSRGFTLFSQLLQEAYIDTYRLWQETGRAASAFGQQDQVFPDKNTRTLYLRNNLA
ncbi:hypothetical protein IFT37_07165 [Pseudomonas fluorescens]|uniref:hypothetical protein n=1 Tax=Pseudomonas fluorescens TaxID=294 RepID=UPI00177FA71D|nr:hypothetical protein [Pseudomonas fluorescens]MBD8150185.1 hypothetical protein [Pseudomonas fluorescens]MBD8175993.1 hypothetical protein [Pseudomonas fluorescens]MBD8744879.1 hypothetical protein [Pseudomonas fluorescens]MBD8748665.1 hypothetical protein [Pseudomonas fluorescens]MBD8762072.1 hypothetical protein [Pseudomonas fluorescens]